MECTAKNDPVLLQVTLRHLHTVQSIITAAAAACNPPCAVDTAVLKLLSNAGEGTNRFYGGLCTGDLALLRSTLARYFQDKRVRYDMLSSVLISLRHAVLLGRAGLTPFPGAASTALL